MGRECVAVQGAPRVMISKKLEKIARHYRIDPGTLPEVDGKSVTVNISQAQQASVVPVFQTRETRQGERERLRAELQAAKQRLADFVRMDREQHIAARRAERG